ncbi:MAG TPA: sterol desaturase family protein [Dongiaceae bacterium]|nr:sterol desaturase family protein [Dongiaceae bacterium]
MEQFQHPSAAIWFLPFFAVAIIVEALLYRRFKGKAYPWRESFLSLIVAIGHSLAGILNHLVIIGLVGYAVWDLRVMTMPMDRWWSWALLFLLEEFAYYWYHRCAHRVRLLWATHAVHHSPEELTLASAYRLSWTPVLSASWLFFLPIIWLGYNPLLVFGLLGISLVYQFWLHSTLIPKLGPLEYVLNTPSAHRVHHASNAAYLDRNYGGILIIFDRLFGTYTEEAEGVTLKYGLVHPQTSNNPLVIVYGEFVNLLRDVVRAKGWGERWRLVLMPPGWSPTQAATPDPVNPATSY